jgi:hypothetical protein
LRRSQPPTISRGPSTEIPPRTRIVTPNPHLWSWAYL